MAKASVSGLVAGVVAAVAGAQVGDLFARSVHSAPIIGGTDDRWHDEGGVAQQPPAGGGSAKGDGAPAPAAAVKRVRARLSPGQVAVYDVTLTDSSKPDDVKKSRVRVEVLRRTERGLLVRFTDFWEGKDKSVRPEPRGVAKEGGQEVTIDVLVPDDGGVPVAADVDAAREELVGAAVRGARTKNMEEARIAVATEAMRKALSAELVNAGVYSTFGILVDGLGAPLVVGDGAFEEIKEKLADGTMAVARMVSVSVRLEGEGKAVRTSTTVVPVAKRRREIREAALRQGTMTDVKALDAALDKRMAGEKDEEDVSTIELDRASGWPSTASRVDESYTGKQVTKKTRRLTLAEGPAPVIPPPPGDEASAGAAFAEWVVGLVDSDTPTVCAYGRHIAETMDGPSAAQRKALMDGAIADVAPPRGALPPALVLADGAARNLTEDQAGIVEAGYAKLPPEARAVVLLRVVYLNEEWGKKLFARLLASTPTQKDLADLPPFDAGHEAETANRALETYLNVVKAGDFDWRVLLTAYELGEAGKLDAKLKDASMKRAAEVLSRRVAAAEPKQQKVQGPWVYEEGYAGDSAVMALAADVLGSASGETGLAELRRALALTDQRVRGFAAVSLVRRGEKVDAGVWESLCAGPVGWDVVVRGLKKAGKLELVPAPARTLELAAKADMVRWLVYPTELGREPEAIELVKSVESDEAGAAGAKERYYIFKFKSDAEGFKEKGWMMGLSGPWSPALDYSQPAGGDTFSRFEAIGKQAPEVQADAIIAQIREAWKKIAAEKAGKK